MSNLEELLNQISMESTRDRTVQLFIAKIGLDYAYGQMKLSEETSRQCVFAPTGEKFSGHTDSKRGSTDLSRCLLCSKKKSTEHSDIAHRHGWMTKL